MITSFRRDLFLCVRSLGSMQRFRMIKMAIWNFTENDAHGVSIGKTLPAYSEEQKTIYSREAFTAENAAKIPCRQGLGTYKVIFER